MNGLDARLISRPSKEADRAARANLPKRPDLAERQAPVEEPAANRDLLRDLMPSRSGHIAGSCVYCGFRCYGRTCPSHRDLPQLDAVYLSASGARTKGT